VGRKAEKEGTHKIRKESENLPRRAATESGTSGVRGAPQGGLAGMSLFDMQQGLQSSWDRAKLWAQQSGLADYVPEAVSQAWGTSMTPEVTHS